MFDIGLSRELTLLAIVVAPFAVLGGIAYVLLRVSSPKATPADAKQP